MTIQSILKRATLLLGAPTATPELLPARDRLLAALDSAVAELGRCFPIQARCRITSQEGHAPLPATVLSPRGLYQAGKRVPLRIEEGQVAAPDGDYTLVYYRTPPVPSTMEETDCLPYPEDLQMALPFYCAALCVMGEDYALYTRLMEQYNTKLAAALGHRPAAGVEAEGSL